MGARSFFRQADGLTVREIAAITGAEPRPDADLDRRIVGVAALDRATPTDLAFLDGKRHVQQAGLTTAGACLTISGLADRVPARVSVLCIRQPYNAFVEIASRLFPDALRPSSLFEAKGTAPGAIVHSSARLENGATIDPGAVVGPRAEIGAGTVIGAGAVIGPDVRVGRDCAIGANTTIAHALIGDRVIIHPGCAIGQDGFGYARGPRGHRKIPQIGRVIIQDDVEIGANTTIDRGGIRDTVIGEGTKIDNLVQIGHNVSIGRHCIIVSQCGISGSCVIEDYVVLAGDVGLADNTTIGEGTMIGAKSGVMGQVPAGEKWMGYPAVPARDFFRAVVKMRQLARGGEKDEGVGEAAPDSKGSGPSDG
jgi:UDP-3-O-[3-hydroxymyristoyl] glucosamine N-acyltransferase